MKEKADMQKLIDQLNAAASFARNGIFMPDVQNGRLMERAVVAIQELLAAKRFALEQAEQGVMVEHDCPAMYACAAIIADSASPPTRKDLQHPDAGPRGDRYPYGDPQ